MPRPVKPRKNPGGRPRKELAAKALKRLTEYRDAGALKSELAAACGLDPRTLEAAVERQLGVSFADWQASGHEKLKADLRLARRNAALDGNARLLIFLSRTVLGEYEAHKLEIAPEARLEVVYTIPDNNRFRPDAEQTEDT